MNATNKTYTLGINQHFENPTLDCTMQTLSTKDAQTFT
jgi:hypothetical protein